MSTNDLDIVLEIEKESPSDEKGMFYRYAIGDFKLWFSQAENGNIYSVGFVEDGDEFKDFDLHVYANEDGRIEKSVGYYPNEFKIRPRSQPMTSADAWEFMTKMKKACRILDAVEEFFATSKHYELYAKFHYVGEKSIKVEAFPAKGGEGLYSQVYPVQSQDKALAMFQEEHPEYKGCILVAEFVYGNEASVKENKKDELISREAILSEIVTYNVQHGRTYASMDADWKKAWGIIANFPSEDDDLVSREGLLDALLGQFGCDLAYYGGDLRFIQEAISIVPAVSESKVDELIAEASERSEENNRDIASKDAVGSPELEGAKLM